MVQMAEEVLSRMPRCGIRGVRGVARVRWGRTQSYASVGPTRRSEGSGKVLGGFALFW